MTDRSDMTSSPSQDGPLGPALRRIGVLLGTALVAALAVGAVALGTRVIAENSVRLAVDDAAAPLSVAVHRITRASGYSVRQEFIGRVEPRQVTELGFEAGGTVAEIAVDEGDTVAEGAILARLDTRSLQSQLRQQKAARDALAAQLELARLTFARQDKLAERSFSSQQRADEARLSVAELEARLAEREAAITGIEVDLDKAQLRAPFAGRVAGRFVDSGARVGPSTPILELQQETTPQLRVGLTPDRAARLSPGDAFDVTIDGRPFRATYASRRAEIDPVTRTLSALFDLEPGDDHAPPVFGSVVRLSLTREVAEPGAWVPLTALTEGPRGLWTVLIVDEGPAGPPRIAMEAVEVIHAEGNRAYVRGPLEDGLAVIADGAHRVSVGQQVLVAGEG